jgi:hypothetical protein
MNQVITEGEVGRQIDRLQGYGRMLAESAQWAPWVEHIEDPWQRSSMAILLENERHHLYDSRPRMLFEDTTLTSPGIASLETMIYPIITATYPNTIAPELVSMQPLNGMSGVIHAMQFVYDSDKGRSRKGTNVFDNPDEFYPSEEVPEDGIGTGDGATTLFTATLSWVPIRLLSFKVTDGSVTYRDDGLGVIRDSGGVSRGTINYASGAISVTFAVAPANGNAITCTYEYDSEGSDKLGSMAILVSAFTVTARSFKLRGRMSMEASSSLRRQYGMDADLEIATAMTEELKFSRDRRVVNDLLRAAGAVQVTWNKNPPNGVDYNAHKQALLDAFETAGGLIHYATRRAMGTWILAGIDAATVIRTLPQFTGSGITSVVGASRIGTISNRWTVYQDPYMPRDAFLVGHKGTTFLETGYVLADYIPLMLTPSITLDDFLTRKGVGTMYATKIINPAFYVRGQITNIPV